MSILITVQEIQQARTWYRSASQAVIKGALKHGQTQLLAKKMNVSQQYLSTIISGGDSYVPSLDFIQRLVNELSIEKDIRDRLRDYLEFAHEKRTQLKHYLHTRVVSPEELDFDLTLLRAVFHESLYSPRPEVVRNANEQFYEAGQIVALYLQKYDSTEAAAWWLHLTGKALILSRPDEAVIFAKRGILLLDAAIAQQRSASDWQNDVLINLWLAQASAYHHLRWYQESRRCREWAWNQVIQPTGNAQSWKALFYREHIPTLLKLPQKGWSLSEIAAQVKQTKKYMETNGIGVGEIILLDRALASAYQIGGKPKAAAQLLQPYLDIADYTGPGRLQPMAKVMLLRTLADVYWTLGSHTEWSSYARKVEKEARDHGFTHQSQSLLKRYGANLQKIL